MLHIRQLFTRIFVSGQNVLCSQKKLAIFLIVALIVCGAAKYSEQYVQKSDTDLLSPEEIKSIFIDLDKKADTLLPLANLAYTDISTNHVSTHTLRNVQIGVTWVQVGESVDIVKPFAVYGNIVYAKVNEETLPGFPWQSVNDMKTSILEIYSEDLLPRDLEILIQDNQIYHGIFRQFKDGLYFRSSLKDDGRYRRTKWNYDAMEILQNTPNQICVQMDTLDRYGEPSRLPSRRRLTKNADGNWVLNLSNSN